MSETTKSQRPRKMAREANFNVPGTAGTGMGDDEAVASALSAAPKLPSKTAQVQDLLRRPEGATLAQLVDVTGWLPHTTRAALTGLRKKGSTIAKDKIDGVTRYSIAVAASE